MFLLFAGYNFYPCGGWDDYQGKYDSLDNALEAAALGKWDWWHVVAEGRIIRTSHE